jgi:hypothetical protein
MSRSDFSFGESIDHTRRIEESPRHRVKDLFLVKAVGRAVALLVVATGLTVAAAPSASADKYRSIQDFGDAYSGSICSELAADPQRRTIWAMVSVWMTQTNLNYGQLQDGIGYAIGNYCPQYTGIYVSYRSYYP